MKNITQLEFGECRFPSTGDSGNYMFCAAPVRDHGCSYCIEHALLCLVMPRRAERSGQMVLKQHTIGTRKLEVA
jgi:hypothetical protein